MPEEPPRLKPNIIAPHGGYEQLKSFQTAEIIYDATAAFCDRFIDPRSRTHDQMVQAARNGKQNISEGSGLGHVEQDGAEAAGRGTGEP